jgi:D-sedoheptulose 7-phosphate isomerase
LKEAIAAELAAARDLCDLLLMNTSLQEQLLEAATRLIACLRNGGKLLLAGNGGSAADAQHIASEFVSRFLHERSGLAAIALTANSSTITAIANDYGFEHVFKRQIEALGRAGDVFIGITTSGNSVNILESAKEARGRGMAVIGLTGQSGGRLKALCDECICVPSTVTPHIQQSHIIVGHVLCLLVERELLPS